MQFNVASGKHLEIIDAIDFKQAAKSFILSLLDSDTEPQLGELIHVSCITTESYLHCDEVLLALNSNELKVCD